MFLSSQIMLESEIVAAQDHLIKHWKPQYEMYCNMIII